MSAYYDGWKPYVSAAARRAKTQRELARRKSQGSSGSPVVVAGRTIATTFWGKAWCENLEQYSDYENRLPRGRTYLRNGSVVDLQIAPGAVQALVSGSQLYSVTVKLSPVAKERWQSICNDCAGEIDSLVELLQGRLSKAVMERICRPQIGLFPAPAEIKLACSCPDGAYMCKHLAAVLYGIGARLDHYPELLFLLRGVDEKQLIAAAGASIPLSKAAPAQGKVLGGADLAGMFGLDMGPDPDLSPAKTPSKPKKETPRKATKLLSKGSPATAKKKPLTRPPAKKSKKRKKG